MADEFNTRTNWFDHHATSAAAAAGNSSSATSSSGFGIWSTTDQMVDIKAAAAAAAAAAAVQGGGVPDHHHPMMGLGLSPQAMDWNQAALMHGDKSHDQSTSFRSMLQQDHDHDHHHHHNYHNQISSSNRSTGFSLDHHHQSSSSPLPSSSISQFSSCDSSTVTNFHMDINSSNTAAIYGGLLGSSSASSDIHQNQYGAAAAATSFGLMMNNSNSSSELLPPNSCNWSNNNKVPQFLRSSSSPPKQHLNLHNIGIGGGHQLHFSNNAPFWNPSSVASMAPDVRPSAAAAASGFFPPLQTQFPTPNFDQKTKNISEVREVKKSGNEAAANKRSRNENTSTLPAFKVRKEKMGDRITALQQLVSPFGKTDTASVLSEAIEYIKFLHEQVGILSTPYMKSGAAIQVQQNSEKSKDPEGIKPDLRSRGLCLVPVSSTFPVTHESPVDFWTPTFGGTYR